MSRADVIQRVFIRHPKIKGEPLVFTHNQVLIAMQEYADQEYERSYGKGRLKAFSEIYKYSEKEKQNAVDAKYLSQKQEKTHKTVLLSGVISTLGKLQKVLSNKIVKTRNNPKYKAS